MRATHGSSAHTLIVVHDTQVTDQRLKPNTSPANSAPPKRIPSRRASRKVPSEAMNSFRAAMTASESQNGRTYAGTVNGDSVADCRFAWNGRPPMMYGFHSGMSGNDARVCCMKSCHICTASVCSRLEPSSGTSSGRLVSHGVAVHR
jgi:hypothetical protein